MVKTKTASDFKKIYADLPVGLRSDIILDIDEDQVGPITWRTAYIEIANETVLGKLILEKLTKLEII